MKKFNIVSLILFVVAILTSCEKDKSSDANILEFTVNSFSESEFIYEGSYIEDEYNRIYIFVNNNLQNYNSPFTVFFNIKLSGGAKLTSDYNNELSYNSPDEVKMFEVEAEDGATENWYLFIIHKQLQNNNFETWFSNKGMNGQPYTEIGQALEKSIWSTANMGTSMYGVYGTQPLDNEGNTLAEIKTGETGNIPITAATLFTGAFDIAGAISNPTDPKKATDFGIPFIFRPKALNIEYKYTAGDDYIQATLKNESSIFGGFKVESIEGQEDKFTIYAILEVRDDDGTTEIGRAELIGGTTENTLKETSVEFIYTSDATPTHLTVVFSSSKDGDIWRGAVGSTLVIDNLELVYE